MNAVALASLLAAAAPTGAPEAQPLSLPEALAMALRTNPRLAIARAGSDAAHAQFRAAKAEGMPDVQLDVNGRFQGPEVSITPPKLPNGAKLGFPSGPFQPVPPQGSVNSEAAASTPRRCDRPGQLGTTR